MGVLLILKVIIIKQRKWGRKGDTEMMTQTLIEIFFIAITMLGFFAFAQQYFDEEEYIKRTMLREIALSASALSLSNESSYYVLDLSSFDKKYELTAEVGKVTLHSSDAEILKNFLFAHSYMDMVSPQGITPSNFEFSSRNKINISIDSKGFLKFEKVGEE